MSTEPPDTHSSVTGSSDKGKLFLLPAPLRDFDEERWSAESLAAELPARALSLMEELETFIVESERSAVRLLSRVKSQAAMRKIELKLLDEHGTREGLDTLLSPLIDGRDCGLLSEAGMPCIADPGAALVAAAHIRGVEVVPVSGPSSILLALSASGLSGQNFFFLGYLPASGSERKAALSSLGREFLRDRTTRIFIETPYRNDALLADALAFLPEKAWLSVAAGIGSVKEKIVSKPVERWRKEGPAGIGKKPAVFLIGFPAALRPSDSAFPNRGLRRGMPSAPG
ncbi:MAG TPA: SAM-dependent methyltransferase [Rectinemataceae bacterium]